MIDHHYNMGFAINGVPIPDPQAFSGKDSDLDNEARRDATGTLHRRKITQKTPTKMQYVNIEWHMMSRILSLMGDEKFKFTYPDPRYGQRTITAYAGDREWKPVWCPEGGEWIGQLSFSVIEY